MPTGTGLAQRPRPRGTLAGRRWRLWPNSSVSPLFRRPKRREAAHPKKPHQRERHHWDQSPQSVLVLQPAIRSRNPQPATRNPFSFLVREPSSHERQSPLVGPPRCFVAHHPLSPGRACRSGTSCLSLRLIPPPSQNRPQSHHSIPHPHPSIHSSRPVLVYSQRPSSPNTTACVRLTTTSRQDGQDERSALASRAASTTSTVARLNRHRRRERFTWLSPTTARPTRNSGRHIEPRHRRRQPRRRQRQRWSDASLHCPPRPASRPEPLGGWTVVRSGRLLPRQHPLSARMFHHDRVATALRR